MKRFHVHLHVKDLQSSIAFYSKLFSAQPARVKSDYAKWMLDDPRLNFAISTRGQQAGVDHLGFQVDHADELNALKDAAAAADMSTFDEGETTCCYSRSDKHWIVDPDGTAWEHFHTLDSIPVFSEKPTAPEIASTDASACCSPVPALQKAHAAATVTSAAATCCAPAAIQQSAPVGVVQFSTRKPLGISVKPEESLGACCGPSSSADKQS